jgi:pimeloyl-ACP methyl ester carboxylesterase
MAQPTAIMVHGAFCAGWAFDAFRQPFEAAGYRCLAPTLRGHGHGQSAVGASMADYAKDIAAQIAAEAEPPVLIGHSLGGLVAQMAAARAPVRALILLAPSAPWGIAGGSLEEAASAVSLYAMGPYWLQVVEPAYPLARRYSLDKIDKPTRKSIFTRMVPESGRALWETLNWWLDPFMTTQVMPGRIKAPVLALVGEHDLIHPPSTVRQTSARLKGETRVLPAMSHWLLSEPGWEHVAAQCLDWLSASQSATAA